MDSISDSDSEDAGSIPAGATKSHRIKSIQEILFTYSKNTQMVFDDEFRNWVNVTLKS